jgi:hypothetical protein
MPWTRGLATQCVPNAPAEHLIELAFVLGRPPIASFQNAMQDLKIPDSRADAIALVLIGLFHTHSMGYGPVRLWSVPCPIAI